MAFPKQEAHGLSAFMRRQVAAIKTRFHEAASIGKEIADAHDLFAPLRRDITLKRLRCEKTIRHRQRPSRERRQNWIVLQHESDQTIWDRGSEQLLGGFPERIDVHRSLKSEQIFLDCRIGHRSAPDADSRAWPHLLVPSRAISIRVPERKVAPLNNREIRKGNLSYLAIIKRCVRFTLERKENIANETRHQRAGKRPGLGKPSSW